MTNSETIAPAQMRGGRGNRAFQIREAIREHGALNHREIAEKLGVTDPKEIRSIQTIASRMACSGMLVREEGPRPRRYSIGREVNDMFVHSPEVYRQRARERHTAFMREYRRRKRAEATPEQAAAYREKRSRVRSEARTRAAIRAAHLVCAKPRQMGRKPEPVIVAAPDGPQARARHRGRASTSTSTGQDRTCSTAGARDRGAVDGPHRAATRAARIAAGHGATTAQAPGRRVVVVA